MTRQKTVSDDAVLDATLRVLTEVGPARFTLALAGAAAGLAPATLMQRYGSKHALIVAALQRSNVGLRAAIAELVRGGPSEARLLAFLTDLARSLGDREAMAHNLSLLSEDMRDPDLAALAAERSAMLRTAIGQLLPADLTVPSAEAAPMIEAQWHGAIIQAALMGESDIAGRVHERLQALLALLADDKPRPAAS